MRLRTEPYRGESVVRTCMSRSWAKASEHSRRGDVEVQVWGYGV